MLFIIFGLIVWFGGGLALCVYLLLQEKNEMDNEIILENNIYEDFEEEPVVEKLDTTDSDSSLIEDFEIEDNNFEEYRLNIMNEEKEKEEKEMLILKEPEVVEEPELKEDCEKEVTDDTMECESLLVCEIEENYKNFKEELEKAKVELEENEEKFELKSKEEHEKLLASIQETREKIKEIKERTRLEIAKLKEEKEKTLEKMDKKIASKDEKNGVVGEDGEEYWLHRTVGDYVNQIKNNKTNDEKLDEIINSEGFSSYRNFDLEKSNKNNVLPKDFNTFKLEVNKIKPRVKSTYQKYLDILNGK